MKRIYVFFRDYAVSEVVGGLLLVVVAVISFSVIYAYFFQPLNNLDYDTSVKINGMVNDDGNVMLEHVGGNPLETYKVVVRYPNGTYIGSQKYLDDYWKIGEYRYPLENITDIRLVNDSVSLKITVFFLHKDGSEQRIFTWEPCGQIESLRSNCPILISSLRTNVVDEDLICYSYPVIPGVNDTTSYIYNWKVNGVSLMCLNMPFDTENNATCKDYSGYGIVAQLKGVLWTPNGIVGGAYYFDGSSEYITMSLPNVFYDIPNNDFTISMWLKSENISDNNAVVLMASETNQNFVKIFLYGNEVHVGVCVDGIKDAVRTEDLSSGEWYHITAVWDANKKMIYVYCNGEEYTLAGERNFALGAGVGLFEIGHGTASSKFWDGYMDQFEVYNKALSQDQIYQSYLSTKDGQYDRRVFVSEETSVGETWQCVVTPNNITQDGSPIASNILNIINYSGGD
jgi:hypothetical protein